MQKDVSLSWPEIEDLFYELNRGSSAAYTKLIIGNQKLVMSVAHKFKGRGVPFEDLVQEGNLGLINAIKKFEVSRGFTFSTYATFWIKQAMQVCLARQGSLIKIPDSVVRKRYEYYKKIKELQHLGDFTELKKIKEEFCDFQEANNAYTKEFESSDLEGVTFIDPVEKDERQHQDHMTFKVIEDWLLRKNGAEQILIYSRFGGNAGLTFNDLAKIYGCFPAKLSHRLERLLRELRAMIFKLQKGGA